MAGGKDLELTEELKVGLRDQINTDEITPAYVCLFYDETLGDFPYLALSTVNPETGASESPVGRNAVRNGGFVCSVAGKRRGKPGAHRAGVGVEEPRLARLHPGVTQWEPGKTIEPITPRKLAMV